MLYAFRATVEGQNVTLAETNPKKEKYEAIVILTTPLRSDPVSPADQRSLHLAPQTENLSAGTVPSSRQTDHATALSKLSTAKGVSPVGSSFSTPVNDSLSPLYHDQTKRDARRNSAAGDIYVDVNKDTYQRRMQGEQIQLVFEEGGTYLRSPFILVENRSQLYINFYLFHEGRAIPLEKKEILSQIFEIKGLLPGFVKLCKPAQMVSQNGGYVIVSKGILQC